MLLSVYWFNPLLWLAYLLLCRDIELACDEKVVRGMEPQQRADYSQALLSCSVRRPAIATCPEQTTIYGLRDYLEALKYLPQEEIRRLAPDADQFSITHVAEGVPGGDRTITYTDDGVSDLGGWFIHLVVQPLYQDASGGYQGTGDEAIHLFYGTP